MDSKRKLIFFGTLFFLMCSLSSCSVNEDIIKHSNDVVIVPTTKSFYSESSESYRVSLSSARLLIQDLYGKEIEWEITPYIYNQDTLFYIFNSDNKGWKIVSRDSRTSPVLAECKNGRIDLSGNLDIPIQVILETSQSLLSSLKESSSPASDCSKIWAPYLRASNPSHNRDTDAHWIKVFVSSSTVSTSNVETIDHLIPTKWDQDSPWNIKTPVNNLGQHCKVGCAAVALGQIMYYFNQNYGYPNLLYENVSLNTSYPFPSRNQIVLSNPANPSSRWDYMALTSSSGGNTSYVADLLAYVGVCLNMDYGLSSSTTTLSSSSLSSVGLSGTQNTVSSNLVSSIIDNIENGLPVIARGNPSSGGVGHAWIIDGYVHDQTLVSSTFIYYYVDDPSSLNGTYNGYPIMGVYNDEEMDSLLPNHVNGSQVVEYNVLNNHYFLMNWGESGGYYDDIQVSTSNWVYNGVSYSNPSTSCIYNIHQL